MLLSPPRASADMPNRRRMLSPNNVMIPIAAMAISAAIPDLDVVAPVFDFRHADLLGHRGLLHGLPFAALLALLGALTFPAARRAAFALLFAAAASHGLLDMLTHGDVGVALLSPLTR